MATFFALFLLLSDGGARAEEDPPPSKEKPPLTEILKPKSIERLHEDLDVVTNGQWSDEDYQFVNAVEIRVPLRFSRARVLDFSLYPKISSAIKKMEYDPKTKIIEMVGEAGGFHLHSWVQIEKICWDEIHYRVVKGDLKGFFMKAYLWEKEGRTIAAAKGTYPNGKKLLPGVVAAVFVPLSEVVIGIATKNFRSYIEEEYKKAKRS